MTLERWFESFPLSELTAGILTEENAQSPSMTEIKGAYYISNKFYKFIDTSDDEADG